MDKKTKKIIAILVTLLVVTNIATYLLTINGIITGGNTIVVKASNPTVATDVKKIAALEERIQSDYYQDVDDQTLMDGALKGMFDSLGDQYSAYYTTEEYQDLLMTTTGNYEGVGLLVSEDDNKDTVVVTPYKDTPAGNAGIQTGDTITKVDGEDVTGKGVDYTVSKLRGDAGTVVNVTIKRGDQEMSFDLVRAQIDTETVESQVMDGNVGYISISEFTEKTAEDFDSQLSDLQDQGVKALVIDLRYNGGGLVNQAVDVADRLLGETEVVYTVDKNGNRQDYTSSDEQKVDIPIVVLVNKGTASASEILSGAIQDTQAGKLVGTQTFGKGIVQEVVSLADGSGFKLTSAQYFTPNGRSIHGVGLTPDVVIEQAPEYQDTLTVPVASDVQLQKALEIVKSEMQ
jgi:carboxyl-terminal processing protease